MYTIHVYCMKQQFVQDLIMNVIFVDSREFFYTYIFYYILHIYYSIIKIYRRIAEFILFWVGKWLLYNEQYFSYIVARTSYNHDEDDVYFVQDQNSVLDFFNYTTVHCSTIFQLYLGSQIYWWRTPLYRYSEKVADEL